MTFRQNTAGSISLEFAFCLPILLILFCGAVEITQYVRASMKFNAATRTVANLVAESPSANNLANVCNGARLTMLPFSEAAFTASIASVTKNATTKNIAVDWQDSTCGGGSDDAKTIATGFIANPGDSVIVVAASYAYKPFLRVVLPASFNFTLTSTAVARPRNNQPITKG